MFHAHNTDFEYHAYCICGPVGRDDDDVDNDVEYVFGVLLGFSVAKRTRLSASEVW